MEESQIKYTCVNFLVLNSFGTNFIKKAPEIPNLFCKTTTYWVFLLFWPNPSPGVHPFMMIKYNMF